MRWWDGGPGWADWLFMSVGIAAIWVLVVIAITALLPRVQEERADGRRRPGPEDTLRVLDEQLASGQLDLQDYCARRELLSHSR